MWVRVLETAGDGWRRLETAGDGWRRLETLETLETGGCGGEVEDGGAVGPPRGFERGVVPSNNSRAQPAACGTHRRSGYVASSPADGSVFLPKLKEGLAKHTPALNQMMMCLSQHSRATTTSEQLSACLGSQGACVG